MILVHLSLIAIPLAILRAKRTPMQFDGEDDKVLSGSWFSSLILQGMSIGRSPEWNSMPSHSNRKKIIREISREKEISYTEALRIYQKLRIPGTITLESQNGPNLIVDINSSFDHGDTVYTYIRSVSGNGKTPLGFDIAKSAMSNGIKVFQFVFSDDVSMLEKDHPEAHIVRIDKKWIREIGSNEDKIEAWVEKSCSSSHAHTLFVWETGFNMTYEVSVDESYTKEQFLVWTVAVSIIETVGFMQSHRGESIIIMDEVYDGSRGEYPIGHHEIEEALRRGSREYFNRFHVFFLTESSYTTSYFQTLLLEDGSLKKMSSSMISVEEEFSDEI